jgi:hypothetical protein
MGVPKRINAFITHGGDAYCDICIQNGLRIARTAQVQPVTATLATTQEFTRKRGSCSICKSIRLVIQKVWPIVQHPHVSAEQNKEGIR